MVSVNSNEINFYFSRKLISAQTLLRPLQDEACCQIQIDRFDYFYIFAFNNFVCSGSDKFRGDICQKEHRTKNNVNITALIKVSILYFLSHR